MPMTRQQMEEVVDELYAATGAGDWDRAATLLTDDFVVSEAPGLPMEGVFHGKNGHKDLFVKVMASLNVAGLDRVQMTSGGDYVVSILIMRFADPSLAPAEICEMFRLRDGKVCEIKPYYFDPAPVIAAARHGGQTDNG